MATYGYTFTSGDTLTPTKLNNARTVSDIVNADIKSDAAIAHSKLATMTAGNILLGNATAVPTSTAVTGDVTISNAGVTAISAGVILDADISSTANIALSKLATGALPAAITVASANIVNGTIVNEDISNTAGITHSKLASATAGQVLLGTTTTGVITATTLSGDVTVNGAGVTAIGSQVIVDGDISNTAAIALSKLATGALPTAITVSSSNMVTATAQSLVPAGAVMPFAMNSAPSGWLAADGTAVSRSTYAALFTAIGVAHGAGDGVNTFNLPDLRGIFVRGSGSQTISGDTYSGTFASKLKDQMQLITGWFRAYSFDGARAGAFTLASTGSVNNFAAGAFANDSVYNFSSADSSGARTGDQTHPANISLLYCIKF